MNVQDRTASKSFCGVNFSSLAPAKFVKKDDRRDPGFTVAFIPNTDYSDFKLLRFSPVDCSVVNIDI